MTFDWAAMGTFVQNVGIPFAILLLFVGPFVLLAYRLVSKYGERLAESHLNFLDTGAKSQEQNAKSQEKNAETLEKLEKVIAVKHVDHEATHNTLRLLAHAGLAIIDEDRKLARNKLESVEQALLPKFRKDNQE